MATRIERGDLKGLDALRAESLALPWFSDLRPLRGVAGYADWRLNGFLSRSLGKLFRGQPGEVLLLPPRSRLPCARVFLFGMGPARTAGRSLGDVVAHMRAVLEGARAGAVAVGPPLGPGLSAQQWLGALGGLGRDVVVLDADGSFRGPGA